MLQTDGEIFYKSGTGGRETYNSLSPAPAKFKELDFVEKKWKRLRS